TRAGAKPACGRLDEAIESVELAVDPDPQRLKRLGRRIDAHVAAAMRDRATNDRGEPPGGVDRRLAARLNQSARDAPREARLAVLKDRVREIALARLRDQIGRRVWRGAVHAHVQRLVAHEAEAAPRRIKLHRRTAEVGQRAVDLDDAAALEDLV